MTFDLAMEGILKGERCRRKDWNRPKYIAISSGYILYNVRTVIMVMQDGTLNAWSPSQCDMLAGDWFRVNEM